MPKAGDASSKLMLVKRITDGGLGAKPPASARFLLLFGKNSYFTAIGSLFARVQSLEKTRFLTLKSRLKN